MELTVLFTTSRSAALRLFDIIRPVPLFNIGNNYLCKIKNIVLCFHDFFPFFTCNNSNFSEIRLIKNI